MQFRGVWKTLCGPDGGAYLHLLWSDCAERFPEYERVSPVGLNLGAVDCTADPTIIPIVFPPPLVGLEAHFGAIAVHPSRRKRFFGKEPATVRYLLLERMLEEASTFAIVCEWRVDAAVKFEGERERVPALHLNHRIGLAPKLPAFLDCVKKLLVD